MDIKGVNLGNWLVLEKWMEPALFAGTDAQDEYYLPRRLPRADYEARIHVHRSEFISERDFAAIRRMGLNTVRIPVPYFIFGDREPFIGCVEELDKAFSWAEKYGLGILIDLHTAPLGQNGFDNGGICGVCRWSQVPQEVDFVLSVLERLARRYGQRPALWGITPINEPVTAPAWADVSDIQRRYPPVDKEMAAGSAPITLNFLRDFYDRAFDRILPHIRQEAFVVFHDGFQLSVWQEFLTREKFRGRVVLDTHQYLMTPDADGRRRSLEDYRKYIEENWAGPLAAVQQYVPVVVGEWCLSNALAADPALTEQARREIYQAVGQMQLNAWKNGSGYFYWTYKMLRDTVNERGWRGVDSWDLAKSMDQGWFPGV